ncbi:hypothetical protein Golomagni_05139 [Golovinomyces magnicellulatus]|nr:hypothetical protein Golomagni_05139 [Golovinomyces magnicellulatus]
MFSFIFSFLFLIWHGAALKFTPARPPAVALAVRSPYMNTWLEVGSGNGYLPGAWPTFWAGSRMGTSGKPGGEVTGWAGQIRVDGELFTWMGALGGRNVVQEFVQSTSTRSSFLMDINGKVTMNISFISPINPSDFKRQSIIGTYLEVAVVAVDDDEHDVQIYADISAVINSMTVEWTNPMNNNNPVEWSYAVEDQVASHKVYQKNQVEFNADYADDGAHWGNWYWSTTESNSMTYQSGPDRIVRENFKANGRLPNTQDSNFRNVSTDWPVFAFAHDLGKIRRDPVTTLFTIVHAQNRGVFFNGRSEPDGVPSLWTGFFSSETEMVNFFHKDRSNETGATHDKISVDSISVAGDDYGIITSLSARQIFASMQLMGTPNKPYLFLKEISSNGNCQTVDVIFPTFPALLYLNPVLVKLLLEPLYENQEAGKYPNTYAIHDLGAHYPQFIGHPSGDDQAMPLEECGNMIIMTLSYAQRTEDYAYLSAHYPILKKWVGFLVNEALIPADQLSTDDFQGKLSNQTNLALKGIIAIEAMSVISHLTGNENDRQKYTDIAHDYITKWQDFAIVNDEVPHTSLAYGDDKSYGLLYNLYCDRLLGLKLVPQKIYDMQSNFYPTIAKQYGVNLDSRNDATKSDWQMWVAAISSPSTKEMFITKMKQWIIQTPTNRALTDLYDVNTGDYWQNTFIARPVVGGHFALLAVEDVFE